VKHKIRRIHFVGIGGVGMSGIAELLVNLGYQVTGSDVALGATTKRLAAMGVTIAAEHKAENIHGADAVVVSTAVRADNPEVVAARAKRVPVVQRALMLAELMRLKQGIAIAGTHGKTTTTSLVASVLAEAGLDPTFVIGGRLTAAGANAKLGAGDFIVVEADESDASFLHLRPVIAVVTNIDSDHMDTYRHDFPRLQQAFIKFLHNMPFYGSAVLCAEDAHVREIMPFVSRPIVTYGLREDAMIRATDVVLGPKSRFRVERGDHPALDISLNLPGRHNVLNALAAIGVATELKLPADAIQRALAGFRGVGRRFQHYGDIRLGKGSFALVDDYGHHPAEIAATLEAARVAFPDRRLVLAFQPHRYTRTRDLFEDFVTVLSRADVLLLAEVYSAGEAPIAGADGRSLAGAIQRGGMKEAQYVEDVAQMADAIRRTARADDIVLAMGAGSIGGVAAQLASNPGQAA
jgi:UDP-N-acetylmuramate--alanine ligase